MDSSVREIIPTRQSLYGSKDGNIYTYGDSNINSEESNEIKRFNGNFEDTKNPQSSRVKPKSEARKKETNRESDGRDMDGGKHIH